MTKSGSKSTPKKKPPKKSVKNKFTKKVKFKFNQDEYISHMKSNVEKHTKNIWLPKISPKMEDIDTDSWYDHRSYTKNNTKIIGNFPKPLDITHAIKCLKVKLILTRKQRLIVNNWLNACTIIYNKSAALLRTGKYDNFSSKVLFGKIRAALKAEKKSIQKKSIEILNKIKAAPKVKKVSAQKKSIKASNKIKSIFNKNHQIKIHVLDESIREACKNYAANVTKLKKGIIKNFTFNDLKFGRPNKVLRLEPNFFGKNSFIKKALGEIKTKYKKRCVKNTHFDLTDIAKKYRTSCLLKFDKVTKEYYLFVPKIASIKKERKQFKDKPKKMISIDPGIRTFITGITENSVEKICSLYVSTISPLLRKELSYVKSIKELPENSTSEEKKILRNDLTRTRRKITNTIDDMHWKTIKFLTANHENIYIGDLSTKKVVNKENSNLSNFMKRLTLRTNLYKFRQRLEYKSKIRGSNCKVVNEYLTSKMCSNCATINKELTTEKIFKCAQCKKEIDRDVNGARNIYLKRYLKTSKKI